MPDAVKRVKRCVLTCLCETEKEGKELLIAKETQKLNW